jgi:hypothetical protein
VKVGRERDARKALNVPLGDAAAVIKSVRSLKFS